MTTTSPSACAKPAASAAALPKFRRSRTTRTLSLRVVQARQRRERSVGRAVVDEDHLPGLAERLERGARARRRAAPPSAPRRERGRRPRSRRLSLSGARTVCAVVAELLTMEEAQRLILERVRPLPVERVPLEAAAGRVLAETGRRGGRSAAVSRARRWTGSPLRAADTPGTLPVVARIAAGRPAARALEPGEAMAIATGGVVPEGADAVIPLEYVVEHDNKVEIAEPVAPGANVRPRGGDVRAGEPSSRPVRRLGPAQLGALAAAGIAEVACARSRAPPFWPREPSFAGRASRSGRARSTRPTG